MTPLLRRLTWWLQRGRKEEEVREELQFHLDQETEERRDAGLPDDEARRAARRQLGNDALLREDIRSLWTWRPLEELVQDLRFALRTHLKNRTVTLFAVLSLALGIGANTAIFSLMEAALWKPMRVRDPQQLRLFTWTTHPHGVPDSTWDDWNRVGPDNPAKIGAGFSYDVFEAFERSAFPFERVFAFKPLGRVTALVDDQAELVVADLVSGGAYEGLGVVPIAGRPILPADDRRGQPAAVAVISDAYWARRFGRDPAVIGRSIRVNQVPVTIVGVNPPAFTGLSSQASPDLFMPLTMQPVVMPSPFGREPVNLLDDREMWWVNVMGRLKPGPAAAQAEAAMQATLRQAVRATLPHATNRPQPTLRLLQGARGLDNLAEDFGWPLSVLLTLVGIVLLIACANVANLLLARASTRRREVSLRLALGARRARLARQLLTEALALGLAGGTLGLLLAYWVRDVIPNLLLPAWTPERFGGAFDLRVLALALTVTIATSVIFGLMPIRQALRIDVHSSLKEGGRAMTHAMRGRALVIFQVSFSVVLLIGAALFLRTIANLRSVDLGFRPQHLVLFTIDPPHTTYVEEARKAVFEQIDRQIGAIPGVEASSSSTMVLVGNSRARTTVEFVDREPRQRVPTFVNAVGHRFFETMGLPIVMGRSFDAHDRQGSPTVAIVNQEFVRQYLRDGNPIGRRFERGTQTFEIVGVCADTHFDRVQSLVPPTWFGVLAQAQEVGSVTFEVRTAMSVSAVLPLIRDAVRSVDKDLPVFDVRTQVQQIDSTMSRERVFLALTSSLAVLGLILSAVGIYGVLAQNVSRRAGEIGVRVALGAARADVVAMVLREASLLAVIGVILGAAVAAGLRRYVEATLFGVAPFDPIAIGGAVIAILIVALIASWVPARRACRVDPVVALRHE